MNAKELPDKSLKAVAKFMRLILNAATDNQNSTYTLLMAMDDGLLMISNIAEEDRADLADDLERLAAELRSVDEPISARLVDGNGTVN